MISKMRIILSCIAVVCLFAALTLHAADQKMKPFILASVGSGDLAEKVMEVKASLEQEGFEIAGEYSPYKGAHVIVVTGDELKSAAAESLHGGYGAGERISLTESDKGIQVSYVNPLYTAQAYRFKDDLADTAAKLEKALGKQKVFGSEDGIRAEDLREYHYMMFMPYFEDEVELAKFKSHLEAVETIEKNLSSGAGGASKVYRIDLPGKNETVFGIAIKEGEGADETVMKVIDFGELKQTAHLPYELIVSDGVVLMLHGKFRIAINFPDLSMGTFMKISGAPSSIEDVLKKVAATK